VYKTNYCPNPLSKGEGKEDDKEGGGQGGSFTHHDKIVIICA